MAIGSGLGGSVGIKAETTYGTYVAPDQFQPVDSVDVAETINTYQGMGLMNGGMGPRGAQRVTTSKTGAGSVVMDVFNKSMGRFHQGLMGSTAAPVQQGATTAYLQTHTLADTVGKFYTIQAGVPNVGGTVTPMSFKGSKIVAAEFACGIDESLKVTWSVDSRAVDDDQTLAAVSYATGLAPRHFAESTLKLGTFGAEAAIQGVRSVTATISRPQDVGRFYHGNAGLKSEPVLNDYWEIGITLNADFATKADLYDRFHDQTSTSLVWEFVGPVIAGAFSETWRLTVPQVFVNEHALGLDGPDLVNNDIPLVGTFDGTNLPKIEIISTDTAL